MTRTMYDAVDANDVPNDGKFQLLAGYVNGNYPSYFDLVKRFPRVPIVGIDTLNMPGKVYERDGVRVVAQVCDIENGDARPDEAANWFDVSLRAGVVRPTLYYSSSLYGTIRGYMGSRKFDKWIASYGATRLVDENGDPITDATAWQKTDHGPNGENIDVSEVYDPYWPFARPTEEEAMFIVHPGESMPFVVRPWHGKITLYLSDDSSTTVRVAYGPDNAPTVKDKVVDPHFTRIAFDITNATTGSIVNEGTSPIAGVVDYA